ncbi:unnamed protein product [Symbiodinium natans]|uniref:Uncharacterized protein n=1 Tax=Symbiodinium natans TaxID=878477 RepID=A0A812S2Z2_9DINO|nr:unnamed protein product [Symbiodinium natans]
MVSMAQGIYVRVANASVACMVRTRLKTPCLKLQTDLQAGYESWQQLSSMLRSLQGPSCFSLQAAWGEVRGAFQRAAVRGGSSRHRSKAMPDSFAKRWRRSREAVVSESGPGFGLGFWECEEREPKPRPMRRTEMKLLALLRAWAPQ